MSIDNFIKKNKRFGFKPAAYFRSDGEQGVKNLARLCAALGYSDPMLFGQFDGACYGDLINFLEDNQGAVDAMVEWIEENYSEEIDSDDDDDSEESEDDDSDDDDDDDDSDDNDDEDDDD